MIAIIAVVAVFAVLGAVGVFSPPETLSITQVSFNFSCVADQVLFSLTNTGQVDVMVSQVVAAQIGVPGQLVSTQLTSGALPKGASTILIAFFPGAIFVGGAAYAFTLVTSRGGSFPTSSTVPAFTVTEQLTVDQITFNGGSGITFSLSNPGTCDASIASATVRGPGISGTVTGNILSGNYVTAGSSSPMAVNFSGVAFQSGQRYTFTLISSRGNRWVAPANAP